MPWSTELQSHTITDENLSWLNNATSGDYNDFPSRRLQLPAVIIESVARRTSAGYELGSGALKKEQDVLLTVVSENKYEKNLIRDILADQKHKSIVLYDSDKVIEDNKQTFFHNGNINPNRGNYTEIISNPDYYYATAWIKDAFVSEVVTKTPNFHMAKIRYQIEVIQ